MMGTVPTSPMEDITVAQYEARKLKNKVIARGIALILVGAFLVYLSGVWPIIFGGVLVLAGIGTIIQAVRIKS